LSGCYHEVIPMAACVICGKLAVYAVRTAVDECPMCKCCQLETLQRHVRSNTFLQTWKLEMNELTNPTEPLNVIAPEPNAMATMDDMKIIGRRYELSAEIAKGMAKMSLLPEHLRTKKVEGVIVPLEPEEVVGNCILIVNQALRWQLDPFAMAPETYVVPGSGKLSYQGKLVAAVINSRAGLRENLRYDFTGSGPEMEVLVTGHLRTEPAPRTVTLTVAEAQTESNDMWRGDPEQKLCYSGAIRWARRHKPETLLGVVEPETDVVESTATPSSTPRIVDAIRAKESYMAQFSACPTRERLQPIVAAMKADGRLHEAEKRSMVDQAKKRWVELTPLPPAEEPQQEPPAGIVDEDPLDHAVADTTADRWDRTLRTSVYDMIPVLLEEIDDDEDLTEAEKASLHAMAGTIRGEGIQP
jgi:hypothetical protein